MSTNYQQELAFAKNIVVEAYQHCKSTLTMTVSNKTPRDLVTNLDVAIESYIVDHIHAAYPNDQILAEEQYTDTVIGNGRFWCLDPIDGTINFSRGIPYFGVQVALVENSIPVVAAVYLPVLDELYEASLGGGSYLNGQRLSANINRLPHEAIVAMGDLSKRQNPQAENRRRLGAMEAIAADVFKIRLHGAACVDTTSLAGGRIDAYIMFSFGLWDILPGLLIASEAGACYRAIGGGEFTLASKNIILAASQPVLDFILERYNSLGI
jgi:myo-inositol-1(or 4)-monophosphatase